MNSSARSLNSEPDVLIVTGSNPVELHHRRRTVLGRPLGTAHLGERQRPCRCSCRASPRTPRSRSLTASSVTISPRSAPESSRSTSTPNTHLVQACRPEIVLAHSRTNAVATKHLEHAGYAIALWVATKSAGASRRGRLGDAEVGAGPGSSRVRPVESVARVSPRRTVATCSTSETTSRSCPFTAWVPRTGMSSCVARGDHHRRTRTRSARHVPIRRGRRAGTVAVAEMATLLYANWLSSITPRGD